MTQFTWTELEWLWEQDKLAVEEAIQQLIRWGDKHHGKAVLCEHQVALQQREIQTLMEANIRWGVRVEKLESEMADLTARVITLEENNSSIK